MGWKDLFKKKAPVKATAQPLRISDGGSFLIRTSEGKTCLVLFPVWRQDPAEESIQLFLDAAGEVEWVIVMNIKDEGYLHTPHYLAHLPHEADTRVSVARPDKPWYHYAADVDLGDIAQLVHVQPLASHTQLGELEVHFSHPSHPFITCAYQNPAKGGKDLLLLGLDIEPDLALLQRFTRTGLNLNIVGVPASNAMTQSMHTLSEWIWGSCKGNLVFLFPNAIKGIQGDILCEAYKAGGLNAAAVGKAEPME